MPEISSDMFLDACRLMTYLCKDFIPKDSGSSLYIRPFMFATEPTLGIKPSESFKFMTLSSPSGSYFTSAGLNVYIERHAVRACPGGVGTAKTGGNYAASLMSSKNAFAHNCQQTQWLDALHHKNIEEKSGMNFMCIRNNVLVTPTLTDTILSGITRSSILELAPEMGIKVSEETMSIDELTSGIKSGEITEAFACGTAAIITPIEKLIEENGEVYELPEAKDSLAIKLREKLLHIQEGKVSGPHGWSQTIQM